MIQVCRILVIFEGSGLGFIGFISTWMEHRTNPLLKCFYFVLKCNLGLWYWNTNDMAPIGTSRITTFQC
jgi:hypothetical protein